MPEIVFPEMGATALRLGVAALLCALIGVEREFHKHGGAAGLRTHMLVGMGAALITMVSVSLAADRWDPARIAAQIVTGIGFLGAGTIVRSRDRVYGLTTAASIWLAAGVGMAAGVGWLEGAALTTAFALIVLVVLRWIPTPHHADEKSNRTEEDPHG